MYFVRKCKLTIREGDNLKQVASSFCKAYSLDNEMKKELVLQLEDHLAQHFEKELK